MNVSRRRKLRKAFPIHQKLFVGVLASGPIGVAIFFQALTDLFYEGKISKGLYATIVKALIAKSGMIAPDSLPGEDDFF